MGRRRCCRCTLRPRFCRRLHGFSAAVFRRNLGRVGAQEPGAIRFGLAHGADNPQRIAGHGHSHARSVSEQYSLSVSAADRVSSMIHASGDVLARATLLKQDARNEWVRSHNSRSKSDGRQALHPRYASDGRSDRRVDRFRTFLPKKSSGPSTPAPAGAEDIPAALRYAAWRSKEQEIPLGDDEASHRHESVARVVERLLQAAGLEAVHWSSLGSARDPDELLTEHAAREGFVIMTLDLDFSAIPAHTS